MKRLLVAAGFLVILLNVIISHKATYVTKVVMPLPTIHPVSIDPIHKITLAVLKDMDIIILDDLMAEHTATIKAALRDGAGIKIRIDAVTISQSSIKIRIGFWGDEAKSQTIISAIKERYHKEQTPI